MEVIAYCANCPEPSYSDYIIICAILFLLGAIWGSFAAAMVERMARGELVLKGRSHCDHCQKTLPPHYLIPVISWLALRGRCGYCEKKITIFPLAMELACGALPVLAYLTFPQESHIYGQYSPYSMNMLAWTVLGWLLLPLAVLDYRHFWLPDALIFTLAVVGVVMVWLYHSDNWPDHAIGAVSGFLTLDIVRRLYLHWRGKEGMGAGDPKLFAAIGLWTGWALLPVILIFSCLFGLCAFFAAMAMGNSDHIEDFAMPFGTLLAIGTMVATFCAQMGWLGVIV